MSIRVNVDAANPGQFFACCGLLELADRLWPGATGCFTDQQFAIDCNGELRELLSILVKDPPREITSMENGLEVKPLIAPLEFSFDDGDSTAIVLDAWMTVRIEKGKPTAVGNAPWNFWSGQQTSLRIWSALRKELAEQLPQLSDEELVDLFAHTVLLTGRFGFDPGAAWNALDVGFSPNEQKMAVASSAAVELLAVHGLQRFRPHQKKPRSRSFSYATWGRMLSPTVAAVAASGAIEIPPSQQFQGRAVGRGSYTALARSTPTMGDSNE